MTKSNNEDEELETFIKEFEEIVNRIEKIAPVLQGRKYLSDKVNIFLNAYNQKQLTKATKLLFWATLILAVATIIQLINNVYGREVATNTIQQLLQAGLGILIVVIILAILQSVFNLFTNIWKIIKKIISKK